MLRVLLKTFIHHQHMPVETAGTNQSLNNVTFSVKPGFYVPWIYVFLDSTHVFIGPAKTAIRAMLNFPGIYICAFYPIPRLYVQSEQKLACCCCFKYFQLEIRKKKLIFSSNFQSPLLSSCTFNILWLQGRASRVEPFFFLPTPSLCSDK
jgi:hypothetical protein